MTVAAVIDAMFVFTQGVQDNTDPNDEEIEGRNNANLKPKKYQDCVNNRKVTVRELKRNLSLICFKGPKRGSHREMAAVRISLQENPPTERDRKSLCCAFSFKAVTSRVDI